MTVTTDELSDQIQTIINRMDTYNWTLGTPSDVLTGSGYHFGDGHPFVGYLLYLPTVPPYYGFEGDKTTDGFGIDNGWVKGYLQDGLSLPKLDIGGFNTLLTGPGLQIDGFYYFLAPGVELVATPLYPASI